MHAATELLLEVPTLPIQTPTFGDCDHNQILIFHVTAEFLVRKQLAYVTEK